MNEEEFEEKLQILIDALKKNNKSYSVSFEELSKLAPREKKNQLVHLYASVFGRGEQERDLVMNGLLSKEFGGEFFPLYQKFVLGME